MLEVPFWRVVRASKKEQEILSQRCSRDFLSVFLSELPLPSLKSKANNAYLRKNVALGL